MTYRYDGANRLTALAEPGGSCPATLVFPNSTKCTGFDYDNANRRTATKYPNGVKNTTTYDGAGKITAITATNTGNTVLAKRAYTYTLNGAKDGAQRKTMTTETGTVTTYGYDKINRLTSAVTGTITESWTYDANSNRLSAAKTGTATSYSTYNAADQLCWYGPTNGNCSTPTTGATKYTYDANGNFLDGGSASNLTYNVFNQFTAGTNGTTTTNYTYAGTRNDERLTAGSASFLNGSLGITQQTRSSGTTSFIRDPGSTLISMRTNGGASYYYTSDALGSVILLTDSAQAKAATYSYDSWGDDTGTTGTSATTNPWTYAGGYNDTTSNRIKFGARYYHPARGRFTQPDPSGQESNAYLYTAGNPINNVDQSGLLYVSFGGNVCFFGCIGAAVTYDWDTGLNVGLSGGLGLRFEAGASLIGGLGSGTGPSTSVECAGKFMGGLTAGLGLGNFDLYGGPGVGYGGGCSLQQSYNTPLF